MKPATQPSTRHSTGQATSSGHVADEPAQYLTFTLGGETLALGILAIKEILEYEELTVVPLMPGCIRGVLNLRGAVVPVVDLSARLGRPPIEVGRRTCIVIVEIDHDGTRHDMGLMVDAVSQVLEIPACEIEPPPAFGARLRTDFMEGMGKVAGKFVILLDIQHVLSIDEIAELAGMTANGASNSVDAEHIEAWQGGEPARLGTG